MLEIALVGVLLAPLALAVLPQRFRLPLPVGARGMPFPPGRSTRPKTAQRPTKRKVSASRWWSGFG